MDDFETEGEEGVDEEEGAEAEGNDTDGADEPVDVADPPPFVGIVPVAGAVVEGIGKPTADELDGAGDESRDDEDEPGVFADFVGCYYDGDGAVGVDVDPGEEIAAFDVDVFEAAFDFLEEELPNPADKTGEDDDEEEGADFLVGFEGLGFLLMLDVHLFHGLIITNLDAIMKIWRMICRKMLVLSCMECTSILRAGIICSRM